MKHALIKFVLAGLCLSLFAGCAHHGVINPRASQKEMSHYTCNRVIQPDEDAKNFTFTSKRTFQSFKFTPGPLLIDHLQNYFSTTDNGQPPIKLRFRGGGLIYGKSSFSDNDVYIALAMSDATMPEDDQPNHYYYGKAGEPLGMAAFGAVLGGIGSAAITYPIFESQLRRSTEEALTISLKKFGDEMVDKGICQHDGIQSAKVINLEQPHPSQSPRLRSYP